VYEIIEVPPDASELTEALGTKPKFWFRDANGVKTLYKESRPGTGEHWAEKVSSQVADLLGLPHAHYDLARWQGRVGVVTPTFVADDDRLVLGNELLARVVPDYAAQARRYSAGQHTVRRVSAALAANAVDLPSGFAAFPGVGSAFDVLVGYLMLDTLVSNQDRHHENWAVVSERTGIVRLAPTFDHASSLGRNEKDAARLRRLSTRDTQDTIDAYVARAASALYAGTKSSKPLSTLEALVEAAKISKAAGRAWAARLAGLDCVRFKTILADVPDAEISDPARDFAFAMLQANRTRIFGAMASL
jgi:hypothetical protein